MSTDLERGPAAIHSVRSGPRGAPPVILLHPAGLDLTYWADQIEALSARHDLIVPDLPGHGRSPLGSEAWTFGRVVRDLAALLDRTHATGAHLVGISVGGMIAQEFALANPKRVTSLCLIATASEFPEAVRVGMRDRATRLRAGGMEVVVPETMVRWFAPETIARRPDLIERTTRTLLADDAEAHAQLWEAVGGLQTSTRLEAITCPTLILAGEVDPSCPPSAARLLRDGIAGSRLAILPGVSHMAILERPDLINAHIATFLAQIETGSTAIEFR